MCRTYAELSHSGRGRGMASVGGTMPIDTLNDSDSASEMRGAELVGGKGSGNMNC